MFSSVCLCGRIQSTLTDVDTGTRKYIPCLCACPCVVPGIACLTLHSDVYNKIDAISLEQMDKLAREDHTVVISCELGLK